MCSSGGDSGARVRRGIGLRKTTREAQNSRQKPSESKKGSALIVRQSARLASDNSCASLRQRIRSPLGHHTVPDVLSD
jgi:hypothetical protein